MLVPGPLLGAVAMKRLEESQSDPVRRRVNAITSQPTAHNQRPPPIRANRTKEKGEHN
jgi:hypothetical protein